MRDEIIFAFHNIKLSPDRELQSHVWRYYFVLLMLLLDPVFFMFQSLLFFPNKLPGGIHDFVKLGQLTQERFYQSVRYGRRELAPRCRIRIQVDGDADILWLNKQRVHRVCCFVIQKDCKAFLHGWGMGVNDRVYGLLSPCGYFKHDVLIGQGDPVPTWN